MSDSEQNTPIDNEEMCKITLIVKRQGYEVPNDEFQVAFAEMFQTKIVNISYVCDACGKDGLTREEVITHKCDVCEYYYELCMDDIFYQGCPFCNKADDK